MKKDYIPHEDSKLDTWETNFVSNIGTVATALSIPSGEVTPVTGAITTHKSSYTASTAAKAAAKAANSTCQSDKKEAVKEIRKLANRIKATPGYSEAMGSGLGIIGEDSTFDPTTAKPTISVKPTGGHVDVKFDHPREVNGVKIYSKRGSETAFTFLATDTHTPYHDNRANLVPGTAEKREYTAYYFIGEDAIGLECDIVSLSITL